MADILIEGSEYKPVEIRVSFPLLGPRGVTPFLTSARREAFDVPRTSGSKYMQVCRSERAFGAPSIDSFPSGIRPSRRFYRRPFSRNLAGLADRRTSAPPAGALRCLAGQKESYFSMKLMGLPICRSTNTLPSKDAKDVCTRSERIR